MEHIFLISNGSTQFYENTLTKFTNQVPDLFTKSSDTFEVGVSEIIFQDKFASPFILTKPFCPAIIVSQLKPQDGAVMASKDFTNGDKVYLPSAHYKNLSMLFTLANTACSKNISLWVHEARERRFYIGFYKNEKQIAPAPNARNHYLYMYRPLVDDLKPHSYYRPTVTTIEGLEYMAFRSSRNGTYFRCGDDHQLESYFTPHVFISTPCIEASYLDSKKVKLLGGVTLVENKSKTLDTTYTTNQNHSAFHYEFAHPQFHRLTSESIRSIEINLLDSNLRQCRMLPGQATVIKIALRKVADIGKMSSINISATSKPQELHKDNSASYFTTELAETIVLPGSNWKVGLVSCSLPSRFELDFSEKDLTLALSIDIHAETRVQRHSLTLPNSLHSTGEIVELINSLFIATRQHFSVSSQTGAIRCDPTDRSIYMYMSGKMAYFLGMPLETENVETASLRVLRRQPYTFPFPPRFDRFYPQSVYIYSSLVDSSLVAGQSLKLLKIVPTAFSGSPLHTSSSNTNHIEFKELELHNVRVSQLSKMSFEIRDQTGKLVSFSRTAPPALLNMVLKKSNV